MSSNCRGQQMAKPDLVQVLETVDFYDIYQTPANDEIYKPVDPKDPRIKALANDIEKNGLLEPLVLSEDHYILSGHRRYAAIGLLGWDEVCCEIRKGVFWHSKASRSEFFKLLVSYNQQRVKSLNEHVREELVASDPEDAHRTLKKQRQEQAELNNSWTLDGIQLSQRKTRCRLTQAKKPFLDAIKLVISAERKFWPLSDRAIHYKLLNTPPLKHASKPNSIYQNDVASYKSLVDILTRGRLAGKIPWGAIADPTRSARVWGVHDEPSTFIRKEIEEFMVGYYRNLIRSQPNHIEIVVEKNAIFPIVKWVAWDFTIPITSGKGYCSLPPRKDMAERYFASGKEKLVLLILSDFDPDGRVIASSFARSMRDDFGIENIEPFQVALTEDQIEKYDLVPQMVAKDKSSNYPKFVDEYGMDAFELEAIDSAELQQELRDAINDVIDHDAFNAEVEAEKADAVELGSLRRTLTPIMLEALGVGDENE